MVYPVVKLAGRDSTGTGVESTGTGGLSLCSSLFLISLQTGSKQEAGGMCFFPAVSILPR